MDALDALDRAAFAQVWSRVDARGTGPVEAAGPSEGPAAGEAETLRELVLTCLTAAGDYRALSRQSRRGGPALARLAGEKHSQARRLSAAYFLASGVCYWPRAVVRPSPAPLFAALRERFLAERELTRTLQALAPASDEHRAFYTALAGECSEMAERLRTIAERELIF